MVSMREPTGVPSRLVRIRSSWGWACARTLGPLLFWLVIILLGRAPFSQKEVMLGGFFAVTVLMAFAWGIHSARQIGISECGLVIRRWRRTERIPWQSVTSVALGPDDVLTLHLLAGRCTITAVWFSNRAWWTLCDTIAAALDSRTAGKDPSP